MNDNDLKNGIKRRTSKFKDILKEIYPKIKFLSITTRKSEYLFYDRYIACARVLINKKEKCVVYDLHLEFSDELFDEQLKVDKPKIKRCLRTFFINDRFKKRRRTISRYKSWNRFLANYYTYRENKNESKISRIKRKM